MVVKLSDFLSTSFSTFSANDTNNTGVTYPGAVVHTTTLTPGVGIGAGIDFQVETADNNTETGMRLETVTTDVTAGSEDFAFVIKLMENGAAANEKFRVSSNGTITTGTMNAASHTVGTFFTANSTLVNAAAINITGRVNTATFFATTSANVGANVSVNTSILFLGNASSNVVISTNGEIQTTGLVTANRLTIQTFLYANSGVSGSAGAVLTSGGGVSNVYWSPTLFANSTSVTALAVPMSASAFTTATFVANNTGVYHTGTMNAASYTVGTSFTANSTVVNAVSYYAGSLLVANSTVINATHLAGVASTGYARRGGGIGSIDYNAERTRASGIYSVDASPTNGPPSGAFSNFIQMYERSDTAAQIVVDYSTGQLYSRGIYQTTPSYSAWQTYLSTTANKTISGGFNVTVYNAGSASFTVNPLNGNYQYFTNNGAATITAPGSDCAVDLLIINGATPGAITFSSFQVGATGGSMTPPTANYEYIVSIRRIAGYSTYSIYAMQ
jgi:hypothetical protein